MMSSSFQLQQRKPLTSPCYASSKPSDIGMYDTYDELATSAIRAYEKMVENEKSETNKKQLWIAIAGSPGSGKSTLSEQVCKRINEFPSLSTTLKRKITSTTIPMDGYHYSKAQLKSLNLDIKRRGAPWTFDAELFYTDINKIKEIGYGSLPTYSRVLSDPVPNQVKIGSDDGQTDDIILIEGNYLLLGCLKDEDNLHNLVKDDGCPLSTIKEECERWAPLLDLWDETWFINPASDSNGGGDDDGGALEIITQRLIERHLETWSPEKTIQWASNDDASTCTDRQAATNRAKFNDVRNAVLIQCCSPYANRIVKSI